MASGHHYHVVATENEKLLQTFRENQKWRNENESKLNQVIDWCHEIHEFLEAEEEKFKQYLSPAYYAKFVVKRIETSPFNGCKFKLFIYAHPENEHSLCKFETSVTSLRSFKRLKQIVIDIRRNFSD